MDDVNDPQAYINDARKMVERAATKLDSAVQLGGIPELDADAISVLESQLDGISIALKGDPIIGLISRLESLEFRAGLDFLYIDHEFRAGTEMIGVLCNLVEYGFNEYCEHREGTSRLVAGPQGNVKLKHTRESLRTQFLEEGRKHGS